MAAHLSSCTCFAPQRPDVFRAPWRICEHYYRHISLDGIPSGASTSSTHSQWLGAQRCARRSALQRGLLADLDDQDPGVQEGQQVGENDRQRNHVEPNPGIGTSMTIPAAMKGSEANWVMSARPQKTGRYWRAVRRRSWTWMIVRATQLATPIMRVSPPATTCGCAGTSSNEARMRTASSAISASSAVGQGRILWGDDTFQVDRDADKDQACQRRRRPRPR